MNTKPIIALDFPGKEETEAFFKHFKDEQLFVKVGMELFYKEGLSLIQWLSDKGHSIFLDLKLHDIPNTVYRALKIFTSLNIELLTVHAAGGSKMMRIALQALEENTPTGKERPKIVAVTQLTSISEAQMQKEQLIQVPLQESVVHYAKLAHECGLDGVVCSAWEADKVKNATHKEFLRVTPGIRFTGDVRGDQHRIVTPSEAKSLGSTHIVVGRSITQADDPLQAYQRVKSEWEMSQ